MTKDRRVPYTEEQIMWIRDHFKDSGVMTAKQKKEVTEKYNKRFGEKRTYSGLNKKAWNCGFNERESEFEIGVSRRNSVSGAGWSMVLVALDPHEFQSINRYVWEKETGEELSYQDIIIGVNGAVENPVIDELIKCNRHEIMLANRMDNEIPFDTRLLIAQVESRVNSLEGRGIWSEEESDFVFTYGKKSGGHGFWIDLANKFNKKFNKKRTNTNLISFYYSRKQSND